MIKVFGGNSGGILADLVAGILIKRVRRVIGLALGTGPQAVADDKRQEEERQRGAVITGFEPADIAEGILMLLRQLMEGRFEVAIQYVRGPKAEGNHKAREIMAEVFEPDDAEWRGLGVISESGLRIRREYKGFDALRRFTLPEIRSIEFRGCRCGEILRGVMAPAECPMFMKACTPANPVGPCMVSGEGTCAAYYKYERSS